MEFDNFDKKSPFSIKPDINMVPFVDICLVLLIVFMISAPFAIGGVDIELPKQAFKPLKVGEQAVILSITDHGKFFLNKEQVREETLEKKLVTYKKDILYIRADKKTPYDYVAKAMVAAQQAGIKRVAMVGQSRETTP